MSSTTVQVQLEVYEYRMAMDVAVHRQYRSFKENRKDVAGLDSKKATAYKAQMEGVAAEVAVAKFLGVFWDGSIDTFHDKPDIMNFIEVKWCQNADNPALPIRPSSKENLDHAFVLVTGEQGNYTIHGWRTKRWVEENIPLSKGGDPTRPAAHFCPVSALLSPDELKLMVADQFLRALLGEDACVASKKKLAALMTPVNTPTHVPVLQFPPRPVVPIRAASFTTETKPMPGKPKITN